MWLHIHPGIKNNPCKLKGATSGVHELSPVLVNTKLHVLQQCQVIMLLMNIAEAMDGFIDKIDMEWPRPIGRNWSLSESPDN